MNKNTALQGTREIAYKLYQVSKTRPAAKRYASIFGVILRVLDESIIDQSGEEKLDELLRAAFPEMFHAHGEAKLEFLDNWGYQPGSWGGQALLPKSREQIRSENAPAHLYPKELAVWEKEWDKNNKEIQY